MYHHWVLSYPLRSLFNYKFFIKDIRQLFNDELDNVDTANEPIDVDNEPPASTALIEELNEAADEITGMIDNSNNADEIIDTEAATTAQGEISEKESREGGDITLVPKVPKVLYLHYIVRWLKNVGYYILKFGLVGFQASSIITF